MNLVFEATAIPLCRRKDYTSLNHVSGRFLAHRPSRFEDTFSKKKKIPEETLLYIYSPEKLTR